MNSKCTTRCRAGEVIPKEPMQWIDLGFGKSFDLNLRDAQSIHIRFHQLYPYVPRKEVKWAILMTVWALRLLPIQALFRLPSRPRILPLDVGLRDELNLQQNR